MNTNLLLNLLDIWNFIMFFKLEKFIEFATSNFLPQTLEWCLLIRMHVYFYDFLLLLFLIFHSFIPSYHFRDLKFFIRETTILKILLENSYSEFPYIPIFDLTYFFMNRKLKMAKNLKRVREIVIWDLFYRIEIEQFMKFKSSFFQINILQCCDSYINHLYKFDFCQTRKLCYFLKQTTTLLELVLKFLWKLIT